MAIATGAYAVHAFFRGAADRWRRLPRGGDDELFAFHPHFRRDGTGCEAAWLGALARLGRARFLAVVQFYPNGGKQCLRERNNGFDGRDRFGLPDRHFRRVDGAHFDGCRHHLRSGLRLLFDGA